jgi:predicted nucleotidyltransferase
MIELFKTEVGSYMWNMQNVDSDHDIFTAYLVPTKTILRGEHYLETLPQKKYMLDGTEYDETFWELGHLVDLLCKGNCNAIWATCSPKVINGAGLLFTLQEIVKNNLSALTYYSVLGMAQSQVRDATKRNLGQKGYRTAYRTLRFGIVLLRTGKLLFEPVLRDVTPEMVDAAVMQLHRYYAKAYTSGFLPLQPNPEPFRQFLYDVRVNNMEQDP